MAKTKFVYLKNNKVLTILIFDDKNIKEEALIAGFRSGAKVLEIDPSIPATLGWKYDGQNFISPEGKIWKNKIF